MFEKNIACPNCGVSYFSEGVTTTTAVYYPPIWKDGININPDRNVSTTECQCINCGQKFYVKRCAGEVKVEV